MIGDRITLAHALVAVGVVLLVVPALAPVQQYRVHDTRAGATADRADLEESGIEVIAYENLSDRGQELYRKTLENGGRYTVPVGQGAPDFEYGTERGDGGGPAGPSVRRSGTIAIERPPDADLPPADEPVEAVERARERERAEARERAQERDGDRRTATGNGTATPTTPDYDEMRETITRYDMMQTTTDSPPLPDTSNLFRLFPALAGILALGVGGYRASLP